MCVLYASWLGYPWLPRAANEFSLSLSFSQLKMVVNVLGALVGLVKVRIAHTNIDSSVFRLHYRWTTSFCYLACLLVAASDFIGNPITCLDSTSVAAKPINTYCWVESTFTINISARE